METGVGIVGRATWLEEEAFRGDWRIGDPCLSVGVHTGAVTYEMLTVRVAFPGMTGREERGDWGVASPRRGVMDEGGVMFSWIVAYQSQRRLPTTHR